MEANRGEHSVSEYCNTQGDYRLPAVVTIYFLST